MFLCSSLCLCFVSFVWVFVLCLCMAFWFLLIQVFRSSNCSVFCRCLSLFCTRLIVGVLFL